ncbi:MAG TPA: response regulator, partial [Burkholderiaceae bacterium]|nr:response regulator [Burkholderiaceae bacterium]
MSHVPLPPTERPAVDRLADGWQRSAVLIVDDEEGMRNFLGKTLERRCGQVMLATSAEEADALARAHRFDLVILDITLPGKNGITWLRELRDQGYTGEVVLITAFADLETAIEALRAGASDFILKPFRLSQILNAVKHSLERSHLRRENWVLRRTLRQR